MAESNQPTEQPMRGLGARSPLTVEEVSEPGAVPPDKLVGIRERLLANAAPMPGVTSPLPKTLGINTSRAVRPEAYTPSTSVPDAPAPSDLAHEHVIGPAAPLFAPKVSPPAPYDVPPIDRVPATTLPLPVGDGPAVGPDGEPCRVEVEMKFRMPTRSDGVGNTVDATADVRHRAEKKCRGLQRHPRVRESDEYFHAPFMPADTYLRIRRSEYDSNPSGGKTRRESDLTWKGPLIGADSKSRREETVNLGGGDPGPEAMRRLLTGMGYTRFATVVKDREPFTLLHGGSEVTMTFDRVEGLGGFVELEILTIEPAMSGAVAILHDLARTLGLGEQERRGYAQLVQPALA